MMDAGRCRWAVREGMGVKGATFEVLNFFCMQQHKSALNKYPETRSVKILLSLKMLCEQVDALTYKQHSGCCRAPYSRLQPAAPVAAAPGPKHSRRLACCQRA